MLPREPIMILHNVNVPNSNMKIIPTHRLSGWLLGVGLRMDIKQTCVTRDWGLYEHENIILLMNKLFIRAPKNTRQMPTSTIWNRKSSSADFVFHVLL